MTRRSLLVAAAWVLLASVGLLQVWGLRNSAQIDFRAYYNAAERIWDGDQIYGQLDRLPSYIYPPFAAVVMGAFTILPVKAASLGWLAISVAALLVTARLIVNAIGPIAGYSKAIGSPWLLSLALSDLGLLMAPVRECLRIGQVNVILMAILLIDGLVIWRFSGVVTGLATGFKVLPGSFVLLMALTRRWREAVCACAAFALTIAVGLLFGVGLTWTFWTRILWGSSSVTPEKITNESLLGFWLRWLPGTPGQVLADLSSIAVFALGIWLAASWWKCDRLISLSVLGVVNCLVSPIAWVSHWVWIVPAVAAASAVGVRAWNQGVRPLSVFCIGAALLMTVVARAPVYSARSGVLETQIAGSLYPAAGLGLIAAFCWGLTLRSSFKGAADRRHIGAT